MFVPMHWNDETASDAHRVDGAFHRRSVLGQPDSKATPVAIATARDAERRLPAVAAAACTCRARAIGPGPRSAAVSPPASRPTATVPISSPSWPRPRARPTRCVISMSAAASRAPPLIAGNRLVGGLFLAPAAEPPRWSILEEAWKAESIDQQLRRIVLSGQAARRRGGRGAACLRLLRRAGGPDHGRDQGWGLVGRGDRRQA